MKKTMSTLVAVFAMSISTATASAVLVGVDFGPGSATPTNWNSGVGGANPQTILNLIDETGAATGIDLVYNGIIGANTVSASFTPAAGQIPTHSQSLSGLDGIIVDADGIDLLLSNLMPGFEYELYLFGGSNASNEIDLVTIINGGAPINFNQNIANVGDLWVNGSQGSNAALSTFAISATATAGGTIDINIRDGGNNGVGIAGFALEKIENGGGAIPEPITATLGLMGLGVLGMATRRRAA